MQCPAHSERPAVAACAVCGRGVCDLCRGQIDAVDLCPVHFEVEEARVRARAYGLPPLPVPVTVPEALIGVWAVAGAVAPWLPWYRTIVLAREPALVESAIDVTGWESGGIGAVACLSLLASAVVLGVMVAIRVIRPRLVQRQPVAHTAVTMGATTLGLLAIRIATRSAGLYTGLYLAATSAALLIVLGRRLRSPT